MRSPSIHDLCIYAVLEWVLIAVMLVNGCVAFVATQFAKYCELRSPCLLCSRIDHVFAERDEDFHYNESMCEMHRRDVSYLAYCHNHKKLSDMRKMCEACLLSFATEKESDGDTYKSLVGILHKDVECKCCCCGLNAPKVINNVDPIGLNLATEPEESILHRLKRQVRLDCKSLMALYMELDEERNASAVAANNAMAMITRLQADKAAVQMEALQYQRMMEEQAEYDQEALHKIIRDMENQLQAYRHKFGYLEILQETQVVDKIQPQTLEGTIQVAPDDNNTHHPLHLSSSSHSHNNSKGKTTHATSTLCIVESQSEFLDDGAQVLKDISESQQHT